MIYYPNSGKVQKHRLKFVTETTEERPTQTYVTSGDDDFELQNRADNVRQYTDVRPGHTQDQIPVTMSELYSQSQKGETHHEPT